MGSSEEMSLVAADMAAVKFTEIYWSLVNNAVHSDGSLNQSTYRFGGPKI